jgi:ATP-dependent RNA helicase RhlE
MSGTGPKFEIKIIMTNKINKRRTSGFSKKRNNNNKKKVSSINPSHLIKKATDIKEEKFNPSKTFEEMNLQKKLKENLVRKGFLNPTQIQEETIEHLTEGRNLVGVASTGTGKTGSFLIPIIEQLLRSERDFQSLIVLPTRELAIQVEEEFISISKGLGLYASSFIGGTNVGRDINKLKRKNHIIIGTPGRLIDLMNQGALNMKPISVLVLDEFDRMLDMGFISDIKKMTNAMTNRTQTMLFSATIDKKQDSLIKELVKNPVEVKVSSGTSTSDRINQDIIKVPAGGNKFNLLVDLISGKEFEKVLIFAETKRLVDKVSKKLNQSGVRTDLIHGNKSQNYRNMALSKFKSGKLKVLVATDVAARGIDISDVSHVINYQIPMNFDSYVHRIGRTGRAGKTGQAYTFID